MRPVAITKVQVRADVQDAFLDEADTETTPATAEVRAWARSVGLEVPGRGKLRPEIWQAWHEASARDRT